MAKYQPSLPQTKVQEYDIPEFKKEPLVLVPRSSWGIIMTRIEQCGQPSQTYDALAWACVGIFASAILAAVTFPASVEFSKQTPGGGMVANLWAVSTEITCLAVVLAAGVIAVVSFVFARRHRNDQADMRNLILEDMRGWDERCHMHPAADRVSQ